MGLETEKFEGKFAEYIGSPFAIGVSKGRFGLLVILKTLGLKPGDEVILSAYNYHIIPEMITELRLVPIFVDIEPDTFNINTDLIRNKLTKKTKVIIVTHLFGQPADIDVILAIAQEKRIAVIEDCAHALGSEYRKRKVGSFGDAAIFSFSLGKNLPCFGGGMVVINNQTLIKEVKKNILESRFPSYKSVLISITKFTVGYLFTATAIFPLLVFPLIRVLDKFNIDIKLRKLGRGKPVTFGANKELKEQPLRLMNFQAAAGLRQFKNLDYYNNKRFENARLFLEKLQNIESIQVPQVIIERKSNFLYYNIRVKERDYIRGQLLKKGIHTVPESSMSDCPSRQAFRIRDFTYPVSKTISDELLEITNNHLLRKEDIDYITDSIKEVLGKIGLSLFSSSHRHRLP